MTDHNIRIKRFSIAVIGAGPAGLSMGYYLEKSGLDYVLLEKAHTASSWYRMADSLRVISPAWTNALPGHWPPLWGWYRKPKALEYANYLISYKRKNGINVEEGVEVFDISITEKQSSRFVLNTSNGLYFANAIVSATGYYGNPWIPEFENGNDASIPQIHACDYKNARQLELLVGKAARILIVGRRVTAGQLMVELVKNGFEVILSTRGAVEPRNGSLLGRIKDVVFYPYEELLIRMKPDLKMDSFAKMDGGESERLLRNGIVSVVTPIEQIRDGRIQLIDGSMVEADLVIYATGYRPCLSYVRRLIRTDGKWMSETKNMESTKVPGLFFLGLDNLWNYRSRYLRGIRRDSCKLAELISRHLVSLSKAPSGPVLQLKSSDDCLFDKQL